MAIFRAMSMRPRMAAAATLLLMLLFISCAAYVAASQPQIEPLQEIHFTGGADLAPFGANNTSPTKITKDAATASSSSQGRRRLLDLLHNNVAVATGHDRSRRLLQSACSKTDPSASAVLACANAVRMNPDIMSDQACYSSLPVSVRNALKSPQRNALTSNSALSAAAASHNNWMIRTDQLAHTLPGEPNLGARVGATGYPWGSLSENIGYTQPASAYSMVLAWLCSEGHRNNMFNCEVRDIGVAAGSTTTGLYYFTQVFGCPINQKCDSCSPSTTVCPQISGYTATADMDRNGDDIGNGGSSANTAIRCNADSSCRGFNSGGWFKRSVTPLSAAQGLCFYTKNAAPTSCTPPSGWCTHSGSKSATADCDGDGKTDVVCTDTSGRRGAILSSKGCNAADEATGWPSAAASVCPSQFGCTCPSGWCKHSGSTSATADCDGDGKTDVVCTDTSGRRGAVLSSKGCNAADEATGWPRAAVSVCPSRFGSCATGAARNSPTQGPFGGSGGTAFSDAGGRLDPITAITVRSGSWIDSIQVRYGQTWGARRGGPGGDRLQTLELTAGETIVWVSVYYGLYVDGMTVRTSSGREVNLGANSRPNTAVATPCVSSGGRVQLESIAGRAGGALDAITFVWRIS